MSKKPSQSLGARLKPFVAPFRVNGSGKFHLRSHKTNARGGLDKGEAEKILEANRKRLNDFQERLYAQDRWSLLLIFQGMDAAGKDSAIKSIFEGVNPQGCEVYSFKSRPPTSWTTISCGAAWWHCRSAAGSASSTAPTTKSAW
jgi:hypothetical protein